ncbi:AAA family ATPase [Kineococcus sp. SYSU DK018]|uniref:AAA family ATPase n=1 Tax=Kineococcus sp. SYSU DK018 TaxID=3383139 RepID=UPI003D7D4D29
MTSSVTEPAPQEALPSFATLVWLELRGFRSFGTEARRMDLDAPLVVIHAGNSQGKTSLAEAVEFLVTGTSSRRDLLGGASSEYHHSLRNAHLPDGDDDVYVAAGVRSLDGTVHEVRRHLTGDFTHGSPCQSRLTVDGQCVPDLAALGLPPGDSPIGAPVLLQHILRHVLSTTPKDRVAFFKALLDLTDLDQLRASLVQAKERMAQAPQGPALAALATLVGTPVADIITGLQVLRVEEQDEEAAQVAVAALLLEAAERLTGATSADLPSLAEDLVTVASAQREAAFALTPFQARAAVPTAPVVVDAGRYERALAEADRAVAALMPVITAVLEVPAYADLTEPADCPVCATPDALTPERVEVLRQQMRRTAEVNAAVTTVGRQLGAARDDAEQLQAAITASVPATAAWTPAQAASAAAVLETLGVDRALLEEALRTAALVAAAAEECRPHVTALTTSLREAEHAVRRRQDLPEGAPPGGEDLAATLEQLRAARQVNDEATRHLAAAVTPAVAARAMTPGLTQLQATVDQAGSLVAELRTRAAHRAALDRLERAEQALVAATSTVLDTRFAQMSEAITRWWLTVRPEEELVGFAGVQRRGSGQMFINLLAALRAGVHADPVRRDALGVYSDSQLNALGLATFLARAQLLAAPVLVLDDPIPGSDSDHRHTFADNTLAALLDDGRQVILTTFDYKLYESAAALHNHRSPLTYQITLLDPVDGSEPAQTSDAFSTFMLQANDTLNAPSPQGRRAACGNFRSAAERLAKQIVATGRTQAGQSCSVADVAREASLLKDLVPLVRGFALDPSEKGRWTQFGKILNPGNHDDDVPPAAELRQVRSNLNRIAKAHARHWSGGLLR